jgi:hypothetical protein
MHTKPCRQLKRERSLTMAWRLARAAAISGAIVLIAAGPAAFAQNVSGNARMAAAAGTQHSEYDPSVWVGRNISAVVDTFGQPSYWNASHDGGGGGGRYIYDNPNQPHFVLETQPGGMIVHAAKLR